MTSKRFLTTIAGVFCLSFFSIHAGEEICAPGPVCDKQPCDDCPSFNGEIYGGYHSDYIFRGLKKADEVWIAGINYTFDTCVGDFIFGLETIHALADDMPFGVPIHLNDRTNLSAGYALPTFRGFDAVLTYTHRFNEDTLAGIDTDTDELAFAITRCFMGGCATYTAVYDFGGDDVNIPEGWYHQLQWDRVMELNDCVSLELSTGVGYYDQQYRGLPGAHGLRGLSHRFTTLSAPIKLGCRFTLIPYVGYIDTLHGGPTHGAHQIFPNGARRGGYDRVASGLFRDSPDDKFFGGVSAHIAF